METCGFSPDHMKLFAVKSVTNMSVDGEQDQFIGRNDACQQPVSGDFSCIGK